MYRKAFQVTLLAFLFTVPWLIYTYSLTGRVFYWSNSGGANLYWMSSSATGEWGDWFNENLEPNGSVDGSVEGAAEQLQKNHGEDMQELLQHTGTAKDDLYKQKAIEQYQGASRKIPEELDGQYQPPPVQFSVFVPGILGLGYFFNCLPHVLTLLLAIPLLIRARKQKIRLPFFLQFLVDCWY